MYKEIVPIRTNELGERFCDARELHEALGVGRDFSNWVRGRIEQYEFIEGEDYFVAQGEDFSPDLAKSRMGRPSIEYQLSLDMAKELAMVEANDKGRRVRKYFIQAEKLLRQHIAQAAEAKRIADLSRLDGRIKALERIAPAFSVKEGAKRYTVMGAYVEHSRHPVKHRRIRYLDMGHGIVHGYPLVVLYRDNRPYLRVDQAAAIVGLSAKILVRLGSDGGIIEFEGIKYVDCVRLPQPVVEG
jgi:phage anti-repressor protein